MNYWLLKSEPVAFSIADLIRCPDQTEPWDGVRNYQARNFLRQMMPGDLAYFYHSRCKTPSIMGVVEVVSTAYPDPSQFDPDRYHYDPKSDPDNPRWVAVDVKFLRMLEKPVSLAQLKAIPAARGMRLIQKGCRLSVMPVLPKHWALVEKLAAEGAKNDD